MGKAHVLSTSMVWAVTVLVSCRASVCDAGPAWNQHRANVCRDTSHCEGDQSHLPALVWSTSRNVTTSRSRARDGWQQWGVSPGISCHHHVKSLQDSRTWPARSWEILALTPSPAWRQLVSSAGTSAPRWPPRSRSFSMPRESRTALVHTHVVQSQKAVTAYFSSKQLLPFSSGRQYSSRPTSTMGSWNAVARLNSSHV